MHPRKAWTVALGYALAGVALSLLLQMYFEATWKHYVASIPAITLVQHGGRVPEPHIASTTIGARDGAVILLVAAAVVAIITRRYLLGCGAFAAGAAAGNVLLGVVAGQVRGNLWPVGVASVLLLTLVPMVTGFAAGGAVRSLRRRNVRAAVVVLLMSTLTATAAPVWPASSAMSLSGKPVTVPSQLATTNVLVVSFSRQARKQTEVWSRRLRAEQRITSRASVYDVMILDEVPAFIERSILRQVRTGVPRERHEQFLVVREGVRVWRGLLDVRAEDDAYLAVVSAGGDLIWRHRGGFSEAAYKALLSRLE